MKQLALNKKRAEEVIAVESAALEELEEDPAQPAWPAGSAKLTTSVWSAMDRLLVDFQESNASLIIPTLGAQVCYTPVQK